MYVIPSISNVMFSRYDAKITLRKPNAIADLQEYRHMKTYRNRDKTKSQQQQKSTKRKK